MRTRAKTATDLRRLIVDDSIERKRWLDALLAITRDETRERVIRDVARSRDTEIER